MFYKTPKLGFTQSHNDKRPASGQEVAQKSPLPWHRIPF
jgi:hypothetical protein